MCYDVVSETASPYLSDLLHLYSPYHSLFLCWQCTFQIPRWNKKFQGQCTFPHLGLSHGINSHTLYAMLQQNPSSKLNSKPHYSSQSMDQTPKFHCFHWQLYPNPLTSPPFPVDLPVLMRTCCTCACLCMHVSVCECVRACVCAVK